MHLGYGDAIVDVLLASGAKDDASAASDGRRELIWVSFFWKISFCSLFMRVGTRVADGYQFVACAPLSFSD